MYVKSSLGQNTKTSYKLVNPNSYQVEDIWLHINKKGKNYIVGGVYRLPNQNITDSRNMMDITLSKISNQRYICIIAGDLNIDLLQWDTQKPGLEVGRYAPLWYTGSSLVGLKSYRHFFLADCHTGMP